MKQEDIIAYSTLGAYLCACFCILIVITYLCLVIIDFCFKYIDKYFKSKKNIQKKKLNTTEIEKLNKKITKLFDSEHIFPNIGERDVIYISLASQRRYIWNGKMYVYIY